MKILTKSKLRLIAPLLIFMVAAMLGGGCSNSDTTQPSAQPVDSVADPTTSGNDSPTLLATYEAENAELNGVEVHSEGQGFTGSGYVDQFDNIGDSIQFRLSVPQQDYYTLSFKYLNTGSVPAVRTLLLDDTIVPQAMQFRNHYSQGPPASGKWQTLDESLRMAEGDHTITLAFQNSGDQGA